MNNTRRRLAAIALCIFGIAAAPVQAQEATIRKNLEQRVPQLGKVDEVSKSPIQGLWEVRVGTDIYYTDAEGNYIVQGAIIDTKQQRNLTEEREQKLLAVDFNKLPLNDAFTIVRGNGKRKIAIFEDPNCGFCKRFEHDLQKVDNVTVYMFLYPILGPDSLDKARNHWCAKDKGKAWLDWMLKGQPAPVANCDVTALVRNIEFGKKHRISGTPTTVFPDGTRVAGAMPVEQVEKSIAGVAASK